MAHGCLAGLQQEVLYKVYHARIAKRDLNYSAKKLGAFGSDLGAEACFFDQPWGKVSSSLNDNEQAWMLNEAAFRLRALGRLTEALEPMRAGLEMARRASEAATDKQTETHQSIEAARRAGNLSELELTLGEVSAAVEDASRSVTFADRSGDAGQRLTKRTTHADALHHSGRRSESLALFREAEQMQAAFQPAYPLLYSLQGFRYCDLLLAPSERAAWRQTLECGDSSPHSKICRAVAQRAEQTLKIAEEHFGLLTVALDHLTLGRALLYEWLLEVGLGGGPLAAAETGSVAAASSRSAGAGSPSYDPRLSAAATQLDQAVSGLRSAGQQQELPRGLLTRAWLRCLLAWHRPGTADATDSSSSTLRVEHGTSSRSEADARFGESSYTGAIDDLNEACEIASRGSMMLFLADIHLYRARLFGAGTVSSPLSVVRREDYPWESPAADLAAAEKLINDCGYHRRDDELRDAKLALLGKTS